MADDENQEDELLALASIYDERIFIRSLEEKGGQLNVFLELPKPFKLKVQSRYLPKDSRRHNNRTKDQGASAAQIDRENNDLLEVLYLPPLVLNFRFPEDYPSKSPPLFTLSCKWLTVFQVREISYCQNVSSFANRISFSGAPNFRIPGHFCTDLFKPLTFPPGILTR